MSILVCLLTEVDPSSRAGGTCCSGAPYSHSIALTLPWIVSLPRENIRCDAPLLCQWQRSPVEVPGASRKELSVKRHRATELKGTLAEDVW